MLQHTGESSPDLVDDEVDKKVISVLLETTNEIENESQSAITKKV